MKLKAVLRKRKNNTPVISFSSTEEDSFLLEALIPRKLGIQCVKLVSQNQVMGFNWIGLDKSSDVYSIDLSELIHTCEDHFIFYVEFESRSASYFIDNFESRIRNTDVEYNLTTDINNKIEFIFTIEDIRGEIFPGSIYHIFIDRFCKSSPTIREDSIYNEDWNNGIPEFAVNPGGFIKNNTHFGGNFKGIEEKLDYLESLNVEMIYLSPVSKAYSNHKYDVGSYLEIDENFGGEKALRSLINACHERKIKVIFDCVFNHTGDNSVYFNKFGNYSSKGAYQSKDSPFYSWYSFKSYPDDYDSWWGIKCLPSIRKGNKDFINFICESVLQFYSDMGCDGVRLDVADELTIEFIKAINKSVRDNIKQPFIVGEVWDNATRKIAWGEEKFYFDKGKLDSVTNYPLMNAIIDFIVNIDTVPLQQTLAQIYTDYPETASLKLMNIISTHDTVRIITRLGVKNAPFEKAKRAVYTMSENEYKSAVKRLKLASCLQVTLPGIPCIYYGDEIGMQGFEDPFNRMPMKWDSPDKDILEWYKKIMRIRRENPPLHKGSLSVRFCEKGCFVFDRVTDEERIRIFVNAGFEEIIFKRSQGFDLLERLYVRGVRVSPLSVRIVKIE